MRKVITRRDGYYLPVRYKKDIDWIDYCFDAKYLSKTKTWFVPSSLENTKILEKQGVITLGKQASNKKMPVEMVKQIPDEFYVVQMQALNFIYKHNSSAICAYDMGLGKTAIGAVYANLMDFKQTIVLCQANLKKQWAKQIEQWTGCTDVHIVYGQTAYEIPKAHYTILNYEILSYHMKNLSGDFLIVDEVQFFSNESSQRTIALTTLGFNIGKVLALSGTPITRRPKQFYPILHILRPDLFDTFYHYAERYCDAKRDGNGWNVDGVSNLEEFKYLLSDIMIRKTKAEALDLPQKVINPIVLPVPSDLYDEYDRYESDLLQVFENGRWEENRGQFIHLAYLAYIGKREAILAWLTDFLKSGEKIMVFCVHRKIVEDLHKQFPQSVKYYGTMTERQKEKSKEAFLNDAQLIVGNVQSMGTGLDGLQQVCSNVGFVELPWTPTVFDQATDRLWRIGQSEKVNVHVFIAEKTIEENIIHVLDRSRGIVTSVIEKDGTEKELLYTALKKRRKRG